MSVASIEKKLDDIDVVLVEDDFSSAEEKEGKTLSLLENCCVCYTPLHQSRFPQLFPCLHSACSTCLSKQHVEENNLKSVECPSCKKLFPITEITENIIFKQSLPLSGGSDVFMCGGCEEPAVSGWCKDCGEFLCTDCVSAHSRVKLTRDHIIVPQELSAGSHPTQYCEAHREEPLKFYCMTCNQLTCRNCQLVDHRNHSYQMVAEAVSGLKEKLQALQGQVTKQKERVQQSQLDLDQRLQNIKDLKSSLKRKLSLVVAKMHRALLTKAVQLYQSTVAVYGREEKQLFHRKASLRRMEERQDYVMSFIERTLSVEGHAGVLLKNRIESQIKDILFQSVLPAHTMLEINVKVNQSIMTSVDNFGGISLRLVPFARNHSSQSESLLESVPILQNVPNDCIINRGTSSPDSSTQETLLGRSIVVPHSHSSSLSAPHDLPSASHTFHGTSSHTQNVPKDCIINAATSTTFLESCNQAALCGQCPTTHHSLSHNTQLGLPQSTPSLSASSYSNSLNTQPSLPQSTPALSSVPHSHPLSAQCSLPQSTLGLSSASHSHPLNAQCSLPKSTPGLSSVTHSHPPNAQPSLSQSTPGLSSVTYSHPLNSQCSLSQSTPGLSSVPHSHPLNSQCSLPQSTPGLSSVTQSHPPNAQPSLSQYTPGLSSVPHSHPLNSQCSLPQSTPGLSSVPYSHPLNSQCSLPQSTPGLSSVTHSHPPNAQPSLSQSTPGLSSVTNSHPPNAQPSLPQSTPALSSVPHSHPLNSQCSLPQSTPGLSGVTHSHPPNAQPSLSQSTPGLSSVTYSHPPNAQPSLPQSTPELSSVPHSHPLNSQCSLPQSTPGLSSVTHSHPHKTQLVLPQSTLSNCKAPYSNSPNAQLGLPLSTSATSNIPPSQSSSSKSSLTSLLCNAILASPLSAPASSDAPSLQLQSQSSSHLLRPLVPLPEAQSHVNGPTLQNQKAVIPVSVPTTSLHQQNQGQTAFIILPSPAVSNPSQVLSSPFSVVSVTGKTVSMQLSSKVQQASFTRNPQAILTTFAQSVNIQSGHPMFQTPSLAQVQQVQVSSIEAKLAPAHSKGSSLKQPSPQLSFPVPAKQPCLTSHPHTVVSASADPVKAQTEHSQTQSNSFQPSPSALVHQVSPINQPGFMLSPPVASQWVCVAKDPEVSIAASADSLKAHSGHSGTQSNTSPPPPSLLVQQAQVSSVDAKHAESHPTVSPLDQTSSLSSHPKPPQQPSLTKKDLSASMDSGKTYSEHSRTHSSTLDPSPSALGQQAQVSSVDAKHPQCNQTAAPLDQSSPLPVQPKPQQQPSSIKQAPSQGILQKILQGPSAGTQSSRTTCSKSMSLQDPRTIKLITKRLALLKKMSASNKKFSSKVWKFHDCQPYPEPDKTSQPTLSGSIASVSSADGQSPKMLSLTPASLGPQDLKTLNLTANKRRSFKRRPNKKLWKFHLSQPSPDPKQANLSSLNGSASECSSAGLPNPQSENQTLTPQQACCKVPCQDKPSEQKDSQPQLTKDVLKVHSNWLNGLPQSFRDILGVAKVEKQEQDSLQTDCEDADLVQAGDTDSVTSDKGVVEGTDTVEIKNTHPEKVLRCQVDLVRLDIKLPPVGCPLPRFRIGKDGSLNLIHVLDIIEKKRCIDSKDSGSSLHCKVCSTDRASLRCVTCERGFHRDCHVPPITTKVCNYTWKCSLCQDLSDSRDPFRKDRHRKLWLNSMDQRRCEHLILALMCKKSSSVLYNSSKGSKSSVDFESIHERLLRQRSPTYRTPSELVSDIWVLLDSLLSNAEETDDVLKIQKSFEKRVNQVFGSALHPSLLTRPTVKKKGDLVKTGSHSKKDTSSGDSNSDSSDDCTEPVVKKPRLQ